MSLADLIDESVLTDARKIDNFVKEHGPDLPSVENTLRIIRDVHPDTFRRVGRDVWGVGGSEGADLVGNSFNACVEQLDNAINQAASWTGQAKNAYGDRLKKIKNAINDMRQPSQDVGRTLEDIADAYEVKFSDIFNNVLSLIGLAVAAISVAAAVIIGVVAGWTGFGAIVSLVLAIFGLLVAVAAIWYAAKVKADQKIAILQEASRTSSKVVDSTDKLQP